MNLNTTIDQELHRYINRYTALTGKPPSAIPVTVAEHASLRAHYEGFGYFSTGPVNPDPEPVTDYSGCELYFVDDAAEQRKI